MIELLKVTIFSSGFWIGGVLFTLGVVGYLYSTGSTLIWKKVKK